MTLDALALVFRSTLILVSSKLLLLSTSLLLISFVQIAHPIFSNTLTVNIRIHLCMYVWVLFLFILSP